MPPSSAVMVLGLTALATPSQQQAQSDASLDGFGAGGWSRRPASTSTLSNASAAASDSPRPLARGLVSNAFGSHMVLQRAPKSAVLWGTVPAATVVRITFRGATSAPIKPSRWVNN